MTKITKRVALDGIAMGMILSAFITYQAFSAFNEPGSAPPGGNTLPPLDVSAKGQFKVGGLDLNSAGAANGLIVEQGNVGIGTVTPGQKLDVVGGQIHATGDICTDAGGGKCLSAGGGGSGPAHLGSWDDSLGGSASGYKGGQIYHASADGFATAAVVQGGDTNCNTAIRTGSDPTFPGTNIITQWSNSNNDGAQQSEMTPVRSGDYWRVVSNCGVTVHWISLQ